LGGGDATRGERWTYRDWAASPAPPPQVYEWKHGIDGVTTCDYGYEVPAPQKWAFTADGRIKQGETCLLATDPPVMGACTSAESRWDLGRANETTSQIKTLPDQQQQQQKKKGELAQQRCLKFIGGAEATGLFLDSCNKEASICAQTRCASSTLLDELWYLSRHGQLIASWTHVPIPPLGDHDNAAAAAAVAAEDPPSWKSQINPPYCLATNQTQNPPTQPRMPPDIDISMCLQVWAGPLAGNATVVGLVNSCLNGTQTITTDWSELDGAGAFPAGSLPSGKVTCEVRDLYAGKNLAPATAKLSAEVGEHDIAVFKLSNCT